MAELKHGDYVIYGDTLGHEHDALVTNVWPGFLGATAEDEPGCNLVYVEKDEAQTDSWGRKISRVGSCVHKSKQPAHGNYWRRP